MLILGELDLSFETVKKLIKQKRIKEFPGDIPFSVYHDIVQRFVSEWRNICLAWFEVLEGLTAEFVHWLCDLHFNAYRTHGLRRAVKFINPLSWQH